MRFPGGVMLAVALAASCSAQKIEYQTIANATILERLHELSPKNDQREAILKEMFSSVGCQQLTEERVKHVGQPNLICVLPGQTAETIVVGADLDKVPMGTGAVDDWSGASLLPSLYESLSDVPRHHTFVFIAFAGEEEGMMGSEWYVQHITAEDLKAIAAMVNLECLGVTPTKVWVNHSDATLVNLLARTAAAMKMRIERVDVDQVGNDDSDNFKRKHIPNVTIHSLTQQTWPILHSPRDTVDKINTGYYYDTYRLTAAYLAELDAVLPTAPSGSK